MKTAARAAVCLAIALLMGGCGCSTAPGPKRPTATAAAKPYRVSVAGGYGTGTYRAGATVHVWSSVSTTQGVAQRWRGDAALLEAPGEWHTTFVMPARDVSLASTATRQTLPLKVETFTGATKVPKTVRYHFPPNMTGVVLFNHGTGGRSSFIESTEALPLALALADEGYGVISTEAEESAAGDLNGDGKQRWNGRAAANNVDLGNIQSLLSGFIARGLLPAATPRYAVGMSAGGSFSHFLGTVGATPVASRFPLLRFKAVAGYCADASSARSGSTSRTPSAWYMCGREDNPEVSNAQARSNSAEMKRRGIPTDYAEHQPSPLYNERFTRIPGVDASTSAKMAKELRAAGYVDAKGFLTADGDRIAGDIAAKPARFPTITARSRINLVRSQLKSMRAEHSMYADYTRRTIGFFNRF